MEDQPALRRVVVGDEDDGLGAVGVAGLGDDVDRLAPREQAAEEVRPGGDVVGDGHGGREPVRAAGTRAPRVSPASAPAAESSATGTANEPVARSASIRAGAPSRSSSARSHSAASRSPALAGARSIVSSRSTTARRRSGSGGIARAG